MCYIVFTASAQVDLGGNECFGIYTLWLIWVTLKKSVKRKRKKKKREKKKKHTFDKKRNKSLKTKPLSKSTFCLKSFISQIQS
jgi:hypothetical protein